MINVSRVVNSSAFSEKVIRLVFSELVDEHGRPVFVVRKSTIKAVVTNPKDNDLVRYVDRTTYTKAICVTTTSELNPPLLNRQPDEIIYKGDYYVIDAIDDYASFGYNRAVCSMIQYQQSRIHQVAKEYHD